MSEPVRASRPAPSGGSSDIRPFDRLLFYALVALLCARPLISETFERVEVGFVSAVAGPGGTTPATTVWLDTLTLAAAAAVFARRGVWRRGGALVATATGMLGIAVVLSVAAAGDKRLAANAGASLLVAILAGLALVRVMSARWMVHLLIAALLASGWTNAVKCATQRAYEFADTLDYWEEQKPALKTAGLDPNEPAVVNYERRLRSAEAYGYLSHPNVTGSYLAMCSLIAVGVLVGVLRKPGMTLIQRAGAMLVVFLLGYELGLGVRLTGSMGAVVARAVAWLLLLLLGLGHRWIAAHMRAVFALLVAGYIGIIAAGVGYGLLKGTLPHTSLAFRWQYWQGAARAYADAPLTGVGRENFRPAYLRYKAPASTEEVSNPHNIWLTLLIELGPFGLIAGALLMATAVRSAMGALTDAGRPPHTRAGIGAMIAAAAIAVLILTLHRLIMLVIMLANLGSVSLATDALLIVITLGITIGALKKAGPPPSTRAGMGALIIAATAVLLVQALFSGEPFGAPGVLILWAVYVAGIWLLAFALAYSVTALADEHPHVSHWLAAGLTAALCAALIHNLIGFSLVTPAGLSTFVACAAAAIALRAEHAPSHTPPARPDRGAARGRLRPGPALIGIVVVAAQVVLITVPTTRTQRALDHVRTALSNLQTAWRAAAVLEALQKSVPGLPAVILEVEQLALTRPRTTAVLEAGRRTLAADSWDAAAARTVATSVLQAARNPVVADSQRLELLSRAHEYARTALERNGAVSAVHCLLATIAREVSETHVRLAQPAGTSAETPSEPQVESAWPPEALKALGEATKHWDDAAALYPTDPRTRILAGETWFQLWRQTKAIENADKVVAHLLEALAIDNQREPQEVRRLRPDERELVYRMLKELREAGLGRSPSSTAAAPPD
jgi:hypothetical protein